MKLSVRLINLFVLAISYATLTIQIQNKNEVLSLKNTTNSNTKKKGSNNGQPSKVKSNFNRNDLSMWIDESQVKLFSGYPMEIQIIREGQILNYILDSNFQNLLPIIPFEVSVFNFTWCSGSPSGSKDKTKNRYFYHFDKLQSFNEDLLIHPIISIDIKGRIPKRPKSFSVLIECTGKFSGIGSFTVGLVINKHKRNGPRLKGTPLILVLRKQCVREESHIQKFNKENFNISTIALCYPQCLNGGQCVAPGVCSCTNGYIGLFCEGGICKNNCLNRGKCIQKDTCACMPGFYGNRCEYSKCNIQCRNGGICSGVNMCRCPATTTGKHCEINLYSNSTSTSLYLQSDSQKSTICNEKNLNCNRGKCIDSKCKCTGRRCLKNKRNSNRRRRKKND